MDFQLYNNLWQRFFFFFFFNEEMPSIRWQTTRLTCMKAITHNFQNVLDPQPLQCLWRGRKQRSRRQRQMEAEIDKDRYSNVSFVNFYHKFSQSVSVNQTTCPIPSVEIPWNSPGLLCYISAVGQGLSLISLCSVCVCVCCVCWCLISVLPLKAFEAR